MVTIIDRGADILSGLRQIDEAVATALKSEARRRLRAGTFVGLCESRCAQVIVTSGRADSGRSPFCMSAWQNSDRGI
jgi:hypothetical protein